MLVHLKDSASTMTCAKTPYDKRGALTVVNHRTRGRSKSRKHRPEFLRAYCCPCGAWHVAHSRNSP